MTHPSNLEPALTVYEAHNTVAQLTQFYGSLLREQERLLQIERAKVLALEMTLRNATNGSEQIGKVP